MLLRSLERESIKLVGVWLPKAPSSILVVFPDVSSRVAAAADLSFYGALSANFSISCKRYPGMSLNISGPRSSPCSYNT